ncbi:MAG: hypothetical protein LBG05_04520 [Treponema sp.]|jgi:hypothetical protein|nr:hypothetical protein [Treponema sp.]
MENTVNTAKDAVTNAYINMFGILGALEDLCRLSQAAQVLLPRNSLTVCFAIHSGPAVRLAFSGEGCVVVPGTGECGIKLPFSSAEKFNAVIDGTATPIPCKGFTKIGFLLKNFTELTKLLERYLRASDIALTDADFFNASTTIMFHLIAQAVTQIGNHDVVGRFSASNIVDGIAVLSISDGPKAALYFKDHVVSCSRQIPRNFNALMEFKDMKLARDLFDGKVSALACVGRGIISMKGNLGMLDNINRILDRVAVYLA